MSLRTIDRNNIANTIADLSGRVSVAEALQKQQSQTQVVVGASGQNVDFTSINEAVDYVGNKGGGTVFVRQATYTQSADINIQANTVLIGETVGSTVVTFAGNNNKVSLQGTQQYSDGTVTATNGSKTVTGSSTLWNANLTTNHKIVLDNFAYDIDSVDSDTQVTLKQKYFGPDLSGATYDSAIFVQNFAIINMNFVAPLGTVMDFDYVNGGLITRTFAQGSILGTARGMDFFRSYQLSVDTCITSDNGQDGVIAEKSGLITFQRLITTGNGRRGLYQNDCNEINVTACLLDGNTGDGAYTEDSTKQNFFGCGMEENGANGLFITGSSNINMTYSSALNNASDGVEFAGSSTKNRIIGNVLTGNGAYGVEIPSGSDNNWIKDNDVANNTSGPINDAGTGNTKTDNKS